MKNNFKHHNNSNFSESESIDSEDDLMKKEKMKKSIFMKRKPSESVSLIAIGQDKKGQPVGMSSDLEPHKSAVNNNTFTFKNTKTVTNEIIRNEIIKRKSEEQNIKQKSPSASVCFFMENKLVKKIIFCRHQAW